MAFTDEEKLQLVKSAILNKLYTVENWVAMKSFLKTLTKAKFKIFVLNAIKDEKTEVETRKSRTVEMKNKINNEVT